MARSEWLLAAYRHLCKPGSCRLLLLTDRDNGLRAGAALELKQAATGRYQHTIAASSQLYEPTSLVYADAVAYRDLRQAMSRLPYPTVVLRDWPCAAAASPPVAMGMTALRLRRASAASQYLDIRGDYADLSARMSGQRRYDLRRARRRAEAAGRLQVDILYASPDQVPNLLAQAVAVEAKSWKGAAGSALADNTALSAFFADVLRAFAHHGQCYFAFLRLGTEIIAMQFGLFVHSRIWILKIGYDPAHAKCSPGLLLMDEVIRHAHRESHRGIEFLGSSEPWIHTWNPLERGYDSTLIYPYRPASLRQLAEAVAQGLGRKLRRPQGRPA